MPNMIMGPIQLRTSERYEMDVEGQMKIGRYSPETVPYGWIRSIRTFVNEGVDFQPGDRILTEISKVAERRAFARAVENYGNFIEARLQNDLPGKTYKTILTGKSRTDARNAVSDSRYHEGGIFGVFAIVNNVRYEAPQECLSSKELRWKKYYVKVRALGKCKGKHPTAGNNVYLGTGKNGKYFLVADPANPDDLRSGKEIFVGKWGTGSELKLDRIPSVFYGVTDPGIALHFKDGGGKKILFKNGSMDVSYMAPKSAVEEFDRCCRPKTLRIALAEEGAMGWLEQAIVDAGFQRDTLERSTKHCNLL